MAVLELILKPEQLALISAASELLEAAEFALSVIKAQGMYDVSERMAVEKLEAATTKARGQAVSHAA
ncbi:MAG TPA: hypothetical protein PLJ35_22250 [Anaerolineae bacterium]|nr:hypothetical protein [Anaerolineae bacterium]